MEEGFSGDPALVAMMQTTNFRNRKNLTEFAGLYTPRFWVIFLQASILSA
jgi:hypothetical protein